MRKVRVVTDSTSDLPLDLKSKYQIEVVPLYVRFNEETFTDGVDIDNRAIFKKVEKTGIMPQTAAPAPENFYDTFKKLTEENQDVICICLSSELSATVQSAVIAAAEFPGRVEIIDSLNLSSAIGLLVLHAAELAEKGLSLEEITKTVKNKVDRLRTYFVVDTMDYLYKGGRCSAIQHLMAGVLKIHPILTLEDGKIIVKEKIRGGNRKIQDLLMDYLISEAGNLDLDYIAVTGAACDEEVEALAKRIKQRYPNARLITPEAGCVISSHCGPGTYGLLYMVKK